MNSQPVVYECQIDQGEKLPPIGIAISIATKTVAMLTDARCYDEIALRRVLAERRHVSSISPRLIRKNQPLDLLIIKPPVPGRRG